MASTWPKAVSGLRSFDHVTTFIWLCQRNEAGRDKKRKGRDRDGEIRGDISAERDKEKPSVICWYADSEKEKRP